MNEEKPRGPVQQDRSTFIADAGRLIRDARSGSLATTHSGREGGPYASLVTFAPDQDGGFLFLFSGLSDHTRNLLSDPKAALLIEEGSNLSNPQRGPRAAFMGVVAKTEDPYHRERYLARHPEARMYEGFGDFGYYKLTIERVHYVGGFAKALWIRKEEVLLDAGTAGAFANAEAGVVEHMNADHADAIDLYANRLLGRKGSGWRMTGVDAFGLDLARKGRFARLQFPKPLRSPEQLRGMTAALARMARGKA